MPNRRHCDAEVEGEIVAAEPGEEHGICLPKEA